jgi:hypothetical protein
MVMMNASLHLAAAISAGNARRQPLPKTSFPGKLTDKGGVEVCVMRYSKSKISA